MLRPSGAMLSRVTPAAVRVQPAEELGRDGRGGAVGAVGHDAQAGQREAGNAVDEELNVVGLERGVVLDQGAGVAGSGACDARRDEGSRLPWPVRPRRELEAVAPKSLMPLSCQGLCEAEMTTPA
jgi:hypothetical protein